MKHIKITVEVNGNELSREYELPNQDLIDKDWNFPIQSMLDTIEKSTEPMGDIPGFEGTLQDLKKL